MIDGLGIAYRPAGELKIIQEEKLQELLTYNQVSVKVWVASFLLKYDNQQAVAILQEIESKSIPHHSFDARILLQEWQKGKPNL